MLHVRASLLSALTALAAYVLACGDGGPQGELFFQAGQGELHVEGATSQDVSLTKVVGPRSALYGASQLTIALKADDGRTRISAELLGIHGPGDYSDLNSLTLDIDEAHYDYGIYNRGCTVTIDAISTEAATGSLRCQGVGNCVAAPDAPEDQTGTCLGGYRLDTVDVTLTFHLESPERLPLPTPGGESP